MRVVPQKRQRRRFWRQWGEKFDGIMGMDDIQHPLVCCCYPPNGEDFARYPSKWVSESGGDIINTGLQLSSA